MRGAVHQAAEWLMTLALVVVHHVMLRWKSVEVIDG